MLYRRPLLLTAPFCQTVMAPLVEPKSLHKLSIAAVSLAVDTACTDIFLEHGCYGNEASEQETI